MAEAEIKVAIIEDHREFREYLVALIGGTEGFHCTGCYGSVEVALSKIGAALPDIVLTDICLPGMSGIEGIRILKDRYPQLLLLVQTIHEDDDRVFEALCAGASGYILKKTQPARLIEGLRDAARGGAPMSPEIASRVIRLFQQLRPHKCVDYQLTPHETRLLKLLVEGYNYKAAAAELGVTTSTINFHLQKIYEKLQVHSKTEAVAKALRNRLI
jgi:DNA-binding NarL/FixJ family response regulator